MKAQPQFTRDIAEVAFPYVAFDRANGREELTEPDAVQAGVPSNAFLEIARFETGFRSRQSQWQFGLKTARQGVDRLRLSFRVVSASGVLSAELLFGAQEAGFVLGERSVYGVLRGVKSQGAVEVVRRESLALNRRTHVIAKRFHSGEMAADARAPVADQWVLRLIAIRHNFERGRVKPPPMRVGQKIRLQPVRQIKNDLAARRVQTQRIREYVLITQIAPEIVASPVGAERRDMTFHRAIVLRHAARTHARADHVLLLRQIASRVHTQPPFEFGDAVWQSKQFVIERRRRRCGHKPVAADVGGDFARQTGDTIGIRQDQRVRVIAENPSPQSFSPKVITKVNAEERPRRVNRGGRRDLAAPRQAVDKFGYRQAMALQFLFRRPGVAQVGKAEIAKILPVARRGAFQVVSDHRKQRRFRNEVA